MINSNYYGIGEGDTSIMVTTNQVARAASLIYHMAKVCPAPDQHPTLLSRTKGGLVFWCAWCR